MGILYRRMDGVANERQRCEHEEQRCHRIAGRAIRNLFPIVGSANGENRCSTESVKYPADKNRALCEFRESAHQCQNTS